MSRSQHTLRLMRPWGLEGPGSAQNTRRASRSVGALSTELRDQVLAPRCPKARLTILSYVSGFRHGLRQDECDSTSSVSQDSDCTASSRSAGNATGMSAGELIQL